MLRSGALSTGPLKALVYKRNPFLCLGSALIAVMIFIAILADDLSRENKL